MKLVKFWTYLSQHTSCCLCLSKPPHTSAFGLFCWRFHCVHSVPGMWSREQLCDSYWHRYGNHDFGGKSNGIDIAMFWSKCDIIPILYRPRGTSDRRRRRRSHNGIYTPHESEHAECGGVYTITLSAEEFISSTPNIGAKIKIEFFINNRIEIQSRGKNNNLHITKSES